MEDFKQQSYFFRSYGGISFHFGVTVEFCHLTDGFADS